MRRAHRNQKTFGPALLGVLLMLPPAVQAQPAAPAGDGSLTRAGCLSAEGRPGCRPARALGGPRDVALSPGGGSVYVTSAGSDGVAVFRRDRRTGTLRQLRGRAGCVRNGGGRGCGRARALRDPWRIVVSPDGRHVYVASFGSRAIAVFARNRRTGALRQLKGRAGCVSDRPRAGCGDGRALAAPNSLALSPGGRFLYVGGNGIAVLRRNVRTGAVVQVGGSNGCVTTTGREGCSRGRAVEQVLDIALDRDGDNLYAADPGAMAVAVFRLAGGVPRQGVGPAACISEADNTCTPGRALNGATGLAMSPDGLQLYATAQFGGAVAILSRDPASGLLSQRPGPLGCIRDGAPGCAAAEFMGHPDEIELSRDGRNVYVRADASGLVVLRRNRATGELSQLPGRAGCIADGNPACGDNGGLDAGAFALSRDGRHAYVASDARGGAIAVYRRAR